MLESLRVRAPLETALYDGLDFPAIAVFAGESVAGHADIFATQTRFSVR